MYLVLGKISTSVHVLLPLCTHCVGTKKKLFTVNKVFVLIHSQVPPRLVHQVILCLV